MNSLEPQKKNIQDEILEKIKMGEIKMTPKTYFLLKFISLIFVSIITIVTSILLFSFILFSIRVSGHASLLGLGSRGLNLFLFLFPWKLFLFDIILIAIFECLLRQFSFGYKRSIVYLLLAIVVITFSLGFILDKEIHIHEGLLHRSDRGELPLFGSFYREIRRLPPHEEGICRCEVVAIAGNVLIAVDDDPSGTGATSTPLRIILPVDVATSSVKIGDRIFVFGDLINGEIHAFGIREAPPRL